MLQSIGGDYGLRRRLDRGAQEARMLTEMAAQTPPPAIKRQAGAAGVEIVQANGAERSKFLVAAVFAQGLLMLFWLYIRLFSR